MDALHQALAFAAAAVTIGGIGWSLILVVTGRTAGPGFERFQAAVVSILFVVAGSGVLLLLTGLRPADGLHLVYAAVALAVIPLARSFVGHAGPRAISLFLLITFVVLGALTYRLFTTG